MEDDFELLSEAICELLEQRLREPTPPKRRTWVERAVARERNPIEVPEELVYRVIEALENSKSQCASKAMSKRLH